MGRAAGARRCVCVAVVCVCVCVWRGGGAARNSPTSCPRQLLPPLPPQSKTCSPLFKACRASCARVPAKHAGVCEGPGCLVSGKNIKVGGWCRSHTSSKGRRCPLCAPAPQLSTGAALTLARVAGWHPAVPAQLRCPGPGTLHATPPPAHTHTQQGTSGRAGIAFA